MNASTDASTTLHDHYRDDGTWCPFSSCTSKSGSCPGGCMTATVGIDVCRWGRHTPPAPSAGRTPNGVLICADCAPVLGLPVSA